MIVCTTQIWATMKLCVLSVVFRKYFTLQEIFPRIFSLVSLETFLRLKTTGNNRTILVDEDAELWCVKSEIPEPFGVPATVKMPACSVYTGPLSAASCCHSLGED